MYSVILCKKLRGSLKTMGIVIFDSSCEIEHPFKSIFYISGENIFSLMMGIIIFPHRSFSYNTMRWG